MNEESLLEYSLQKLKRNFMVVLWAREKSKSEPRVDFLRVDEIVVFLYLIKAKG